MTNSPAGQAVVCVDVEKSYALQKDAQLWKILLDNAAAVQTVHALRGISMQVPTGKIVGVIGKNGAGKSTLLRVLAGIYPPSAGHIAVIGNVAGLFELGGFGNLNLTGREYALRYLCLVGVGPRESAALLTDIRDFSELDEAFDHAVRTYSSGMRARLYFAAATAQQSDVYLVDELLSVGDEHFQAKCWLRMRERLLHGASGVLITHDWSAVLKLCEQTYVIDKGTFRFSGESDKAIVHYLDIPAPVRGAAQFAQESPSSYAASTGEEALLEFLVDVQDYGHLVEFSFSVEKLSIGTGWEILLLQDHIPVASAAGRYTLNVMIPTLPLAPGEYSLNVFLSSSSTAQPAARLQCDLRSWTTGNGLRLSVQGHAGTTAVKLPYLVRQGAELA